MATTLLAVGCGGSDGGTSEEDEQAITELVDKLNQATAAKDASALCLLVQPSGVEETFHGIDRCVSETKPILKAAGKQPELKIENIEIDGDTAKVTFEGSAGGETSFVKEDGQWFVPLVSNEAGVEAGEPSGGELPDPGDSGDQ